MRQYIHCQPVLFLIRVNALATTAHHYELMIDLDEKCTIFLNIVGCFHVIVVCNSHML